MNKNDPRRVDAVAAAFAAGAQRIVNSSNGHASKNNVVMKPGHFDNCGYEKPMGQKKYSPAHKGRARVRAQQRASRGATGMPKHVPKVGKR